MIARFGFHLPPASWFGLFFATWLLYWGYQGLSLILPAEGPAAAAAPLFLLLLNTLGTALLTVPIMRRFIGALSLAGRPFVFGAKIWDFTGLYVGGFLLSLLTLGIYVPWYIRKLNRYLAAETTYEGQAFRFDGRGGDLFKRLLLAFGLPFLGAMIGIALVFTFSGVASDPQILTLWSALGTVLILLLLLPATVLVVYRWEVEGLARGTAHGDWQVPFWPAYRFLMGQTLLTLVTLGFWLPEALVRCTAWFVPKLAVSEGGREQARFAFDRPAGGYYGFLLGQLLLTALTLGLYLPWAYEKVGAWFAERLSLQSPEPKAEA